MERTDAAIDVVDTAVTDRGAPDARRSGLPRAAPTVRAVAHDDFGDPADPRADPGPRRPDADDDPGLPRSVSVFAGPDADMIDLGLGDVFGEPPEWQERALCAQTDPEAFFPEKGGSTREAKRICLGCEVRAECLEYALANDERFGIWGGMSERERRRYRRRAV
jgi:WhiB family redox-sensing transcriptional regulator